MPDSTQDNDSDLKFIARQPILDKRQRVYAYELLFRSSLQNYFDHPDGDQATSQVIANSFLLFGIDSITGGAKAFINFTRNLLVQDSALSLPRESTVVEVLETVEPEEEVLAACRRLKKQGYLLALDDFVYHARFQPLVDLADIIKVDFMVSGPEERREMAEAFIPQGKKMLAEKVETHQEHRQALDMGYSLFQGYFFSEPILVSRKDITGAKLNYLRMLAELNSAEVDFKKLARVVEGDVSIAYKLLTYINSAAIGVRSRVGSIHQALGLLGENEVRKWASLMALTGMGADKPAELVTTSAVRGKFCELLAHKAGMGGRASDFFLMGLLSMLDAIFGRPLEEVLTEISLAEDVLGALLGVSNKPALIFGLVQAQERGDWDAMSLYARKLGLSEGTIPLLYAEALAWQQMAMAA